jgi:hypothetical protein
MAQSASERDLQSAWQEHDALTFHVSSVLHVVKDCTVQYNCVLDYIIAPQERIQRLRISPSASHSYFSTPTNPPFPSVRPGCNYGVLTPPQQGKAVADAREDGTCYIHTSRWRPPRDLEPASAEIQCQGGQSLACCGQREAREISWDVLSPPSKALRKRNSLSASAVLSSSRGANNGFRG